MSNAVTLRLTKELSEFTKNPDHQLFLHYDESNIMTIKAMITGPPDTPYCLGQFEFSLVFPKDYPTAPPKVTALTTNHGRTRFNPNIYAGGRVCLSILGTWRGNAGEQWSSAHGITSILLSIQSLMSDMPYRNEPGHDLEKDMSKLEPYNQKIRHETIRISICDRLEGFLGTPTASTSAIFEPLYANSVTSYDEFSDLSKRLFLAYYDIYQHTVQKESAVVSDGTPFYRAPFEFGGNKMDGKFGYASLAKRLEVIKTAIERETLEWISQSSQWIKDSTRMSSNLRRQYEQICEYYRENNTGGVEVELVEDNPFVWTFTLFGKPMSNYDGGMFKVQMVFHDSFPDIQPRVKFLTPMYHVHVTVDGVPFYAVGKPDDVRTHIIAITRLILEDEPSTNPSTHVNLEAAKLHFGTKEQRREYNRNARRCASRSTEYFE
ncbi:ubiquitin-conjugating enzyme/RWD-like protein [Lobosporangium transversale]|uniref:Ubiquitin-conjugating enzyme/RWD-like protein n=1 Tax=Lobosporangium transversale TaxID=64571 RepID=A0A1Y2GEZ9_9FUNG|nr:ubiquitin-conjugating enzyme/RWD-like protein [Lobosporangium transversale]ORZ09024.1 ubiquitin-conjugating enzyme/RWD-like protein [Lobosporangium transversale]|eukprot:XP_021878651.1 ubiquitin-conjugating enzyme/RWD-like protein [Lobosporangium transversale]